MNPRHNKVLAIESAISGGSISLQRAGVEVANWIGSSSVSRAEDLLANIDNLMTSNGVPRDELDLIAVSAGPGSFTGIRIGVATGLGLKTGLRIPMASESALRAMALTQPDNEQIVVAVPLGREAICIQSFSKSGMYLAELDEPHTVRESDLVSYLSTKNRASVVVHSSLIHKITQISGAIDFGPNVAFAIGQMCTARPDTITKPLFISKGF